jgi:NADPH:quinone reductase-like Zn-dependent oxidoreductase
MRCMAANTARKTPRCGGGGYAAPGKDVEARGVRRRTAAPRCICLLPSMKAYVYAPGGFAWTTTAPLPGAPAAGEVVVSVRAAALNPVDYKKADLLPSLLLRGAPAAQDFAGVVTASSSPSFAVGDAVFGTAEGCLAEQVKAPAASVCRMPAGLTFPQAASLPTVALTGLQALRAGGLARGGRCVVVGASGGCGSAGVQLARAIVGAEGVVVGVCSAGSAPLVRGLGACSEVLPYDTLTPPELEAALARLGPFDTAYDTVSSWEKFDTAPGGAPWGALLRRFLAPGGTLAAINGSFAQWAWAAVGWQAKKFKLVMQQPSGPDLAHTAALVEGKQLAVVVDGGATHPFTAEGCAAAYARQRSRRAKGKVVVEMA